MDISKHGAIMTPQDSQRTCQERPAQLHSAMRNKAISENSAEYQLQNQSPPKGQNKERIHGTRTAKDSNNITAEVAISDTTKPMTATASH